MFQINKQILKSQKYKKLFIIIYREKKIKHTWPYAKRSGHFTRSSLLKWLKECMNDSFKKAL